MFQQPVAQVGEQPQLLEPLHHRHQAEQHGQGVPVDVTGIGGAGGHGDHGGQGQHHCHAEDGLRSEEAQQLLSELVVCLYGHISKRLGTRKFAASAQKKAGHVV